MTAVHDLIEYMTPIIHSEFDIDAISAKTLVTEVTNDHFPDNYDPNEASDELDSEGSSNEETPSREIDDDEDSNKQSSTTDVVENARLAEF